MNKKTAITNINKIGHAGVITALVLRIIMIIAASFTFIGMIILLILPKEFVTVTTKAGFSVGIDLSSIDVTIPEEKYDEIKAVITNSGSIRYESELSSVDGSIYDLTVTPDRISTGADFTTSVIDLHQCAAVLFMAFVYIALAIVTTVFFGNLFKSIWHCASPFDGNVIKNMRNLAFSLIPWTVSSLISSTVIKSVFSTGSNINVDISVNLTMVVMILIIFALTYIFKYGAILQTESDETL